VVPIVDRDGCGVRFDDELVADVAWRHTVAIAIERQAEIFVHERLDGVAVIGKERGERAE
jgi:hypothetical protein